MPSFLDLPRELRDQVYGHCLVGDKGSLCPPFIPYFEVTTGLFRVSKSVYREASCVFYSQNTINLSGPESIVPYLKKIGSLNAEHIRRVLIAFPGFSSLELGHVALGDEFVDDLASIRCYCPHLHTVIINELYSHSSHLDIYERSEKPEVLTEALSLVDSQLRTIPSLRNILINTSEDYLHDCAKREFACHQWTIIESDDYTLFTNQPVCLDGAVEGHESWGWYADNRSDLAHYPDFGSEFEW